MSGDGEDYLFKLVLVGDSGVGKSNLLARYARNEFLPNSKATIGVEFQTKSMVIGKKEVRAQVWDTAGQERFRAVTSAYYRGSAGALIVYDITCRESFENAGKWLEELRAYSNTNLVTMLVGNKNDLQQLRQVTEEEGQAFALLERLFFIETSALDATNVNRAFEIVVKDIFSAVSRKALGAASNNESSARIGGGKSVALHENRFHESDDKSNESRCCFSG